MNDDELVLALLDEWPDRWRYPDLAMALAQPSLDLRMAAAALLSSLARPRTPAQIVAELVSGGRFDDAERMLLGLLEIDSLSRGTAMSAAEWSKAERELTEARIRAVREMSRDWADLRARAEAVGLELVDEPAVADLAGSSLPSAQEELAKRAGRVIEGEKERQRSIKAALAAALVALPADPSVDAWADSVRDCLNVGEFTVAARLVADGPGRVTEAGPRTVAIPPMLWPFPDSPLPEVLSWYEKPSGEPGSEFTRFRLEPTDLRGRALLESVAGIFKQVDPQSVRDFAIQMAALFGQSVWPQVDEVAGRAGFLTTLFGLTDARLPELPMLGGQGVALWISDEGTDGENTPPPGIEPVIWFRPVLVAPPVERSAAAVLDISMLLRVLAPDGGARGTGPADRRINLLRLVIPRLDTPVALGDAPIRLGVGASPRDSLAWLFDLLGLLPEGPVLDSLLRDSDAHPMVLRHLVDAILRRRSPDDRRISRGDLTPARGAEVRNAARADLLATLDGDPESKAVLLLALWQLDDDGIARVERVITGLDTADVPQDVAGVLRSQLSVKQAVDTLAARGLIRRLDEGSFVVPVGLRDLLRGTGGPHGLHDDLLAALAEATETERIRRTRQARASVLAERAIRLIGHKVDNDVITITTLLDRVHAATDDEDIRADIATAIRRAGNLGGGAFVTSYEAALAPAQPVEVHDLIRVVVGDAEWGMPGIHAGNVSTDQRPLWIRVNRFVMQENLRHMVINASAAIATREATLEPGVVTLEARLVAEPEPSVPTRMTLPLARLDIDDNGPGFRPADLAFYRALVNGSAPIATPPNGRSGTGLRQAADWLAEYGGRLELPDQSPRHGGARITIWLPAVPDPTSGETP